MFSWGFPSVPSEMLSQLSQMRPIVIMSRGHSGTRVLAWCCQRLGINLGVNELLETGDADDLIFTKQIKKIAIENVGISQLNQIDIGHLALFQKAVYGYYRRLPDPKKEWGWKFPETYLVGPYIAKTFPAARYLHMVRDGRDIAFKQHLSDDPKRKLGHKILSHQNALKLPHHLQSAISWAFQVETFDAFRHQVPANQVFDLTFENLCLRPHETMEALTQFLGIPFTDGCREYIQENIRPQKVSQYQNYSPELVKEVELQVGVTLKHYAYL